MQTIPKIFHRIWMAFDINNREIPTLYAELDIILKQLHPDWEFMEWNDLSAYEFIKDSYPDLLPTFSSYDLGVKRHDAFRYIVLKHFGGVFIQHSIKLQKNIEPLLQSGNIIFSKRSPEEHYGNSFMASTKDHIFWDQLLQELVLKRDLPVLESTGPFFLTPLIKEFNNITQDVTILDHRFLYPFNWNEKNIEPQKSNCIDDHTKCFEVFPEVYGVCLWTASWVNSTTIYIDNIL